MAKSLQEIEATFNEKHQSKSHQEAKCADESDKNRRIIAISDIVFCVALAGAGLFAVILSWSDREGVQGMLYDILEGCRGAFLVVFLILIIISFILQFLGNRGAHE